MSVSNPIRFVDVAGLNAAPNDEFQALQQDFDSLLVNLPQVYAPISHNHSGFASASHSHPYAPTSHIHSVGRLDFPHGTSRFLAYSQTNGAAQSYVLTSDHRVKFLHWSNNSVFAIRVDATWFYLTHSASDERIKKNIQIKDSEKDLEACLNVFSAMKLIEFDWDTDASTVVPKGHVELGFSAQNLQSINETFVIQPTPEDVAQINVSALLPYLVGAIQGLQNEVESLKTALGESKPLHL